MNQYPTVFEDRFGKEKIICYSDGFNLKLTIREIEFEGISFNMLEKKEHDRKKACKKIDIDKFGTILGLFSVRIPLHIADSDELTHGVLILNFDYRTGNDITFTFFYEGHIYSSDFKYDFVEDILIEIRRQLPEKCKLHCCMSCQFSSYHPAGNNDFGCLNCFKMIKDQLDGVDDKCSLMDLWDKGTKKNKLINVQETNLCPDFEESLVSTWMYKSY